MKRKFYESSKFFVLFYITLRNIKRYGTLQIDVRFYVMLRYVAVSYVTLRYVK